MKQEGQTISKEQAQALGRVMVRHELYCTPEETAAFLATAEGQRIQQLIQRYKQQQGYK